MAAKKKATADTAEEPRPKSGQITLVTGVHFDRRRKTLHITRRKLVFKKGLLVEVGDTGAADQIPIGDAPPSKSGK